MILKAILAKRLGKLAAGGVGAILAAVGGLTSIKALQPAVEKASDLGASAVLIYCELPAGDRERFRYEVTERLAAAGDGAQFARVAVTCPGD